MIDELITIGSNYTERIKSIDYNTDLTYSTTLTAELTLSNDYESIQMYKYNTADIGTYNFNSSIMLPKLAIILNKISSI